MNIQRAVGAVLRALLVVTVTVTGAYVFVYLWRWEWERAQIAGIFFIAALVTLATVLVLHRLTEIGRRLDAAPLAATAGGASERRDQTQPEAPFPWLSNSESTHIFLPVLLGFGVALSLIAAVAERLAAFVIGGGPAVGSERSRTRLLTGLLIVVLVAAAAVTVVARDQLMTRGEDTTPGVRTYLLEVDGRRIDVDPAASVDVLASYCRGQASVPMLSVVDVRPVDDEHAELEVTPVLGDLASARFQGCLRDAVLDRRSVSIVSVTDSP